MDKINLQIFNCVWYSMKSITWFSENSEFTLDYVCVIDSALKSVESAYILEKWKLWRVSCSSRGKC